jgi:hypothetical protein
MGLMALTGRRPAEIFFSAKRLWQISVRTTVKDDPERWLKMADVGSPGPALKPIDSLEVDVVTDDVSDTYVSKTLFAVSEFANVVMAGAKVISGETLLCANLGLGLRLISKAGDVRHTLLFDTGPE